MESDMKLLLAKVSIAAMSFAMTAANASSIRYSFAGIVSSNSDPVLSVNKGDAVSGFFDIDLNAVIASQSTGDPSTGQNWRFDARGGTHQSAPPPTALPFSESITFAGHTFVSDTINPVQTISSLIGDSSGTYSVGVVLGAASPLTSDRELEWGFSFSRNFTALIAAYLSNGLPNLDAIDLQSS